MDISNAQIDRIGRAFADDDFADDAQYVRYEDLRDDFRMEHLQPLP